VPKDPGAADLADLEAQVNAVLSLRLDALRALAALAVFAAHFVQLGVDGGSSSDLWVLGRAGVVVFFVLSGFVIAYASEYRHDDLRGYLQSRLARLFSVFFPALLLTVVLDFAGRNLLPGLYVRYAEAGTWTTLLYLPFFLTFTFENSWFSLRWLSNGPMWSIAYEFWFYVLYGMWMYLPPRRRAVPIMCAALLAGWKVLMLFPIWLAGVWLYRNREVIGSWQPVWHKAALCLGVGSLAFWVSVGEMFPRLLLQMGQRHLAPGFHAAVLCDVLLLSAAAAIICGLMTRRTGEIARPPLPYRVLSSMAGFSFTLYLLHVPLLLFVRATSLYDPGSVSQSMAAASAVFAMTYLIARLTENRKDSWLQLVRALWSAAAALWAQVRSKAQSQSTPA
jgi:peptidoglycan/LPS O-acetylase OafA/YrhL